MKPAKTPSISVIMSVYNGELYLQEAINSILSQNDADLEFLICDDASSDGTARILQAIQDSRVFVHHNEQNLGLTKSLNKILFLARGRYIARMDADDIALPGRLQKQAQFLDANPDVGILGSSVLQIDAQGNPGKTATRPLSPEQISWTSIFDNPFFHPSVMFRKELLEVTSSYDTSARYAQDFEFFSRLLGVTRGANLAEPLLKYRIHPASITIARRQAQLEVHDSVMHRNIKARTGIDLTSAQTSAIRRFVWCLGNETASPDVRRGAALQFVNIFQTYLKFAGPAEARAAGSNTLFRLSRAWLASPSDLFLPRLLIKIASTEPSLIKDFLGLAASRLRHL
jgi:glycosyltransferase involved in cell wall biosynthesis